ncbi:hypothetical protein BUALT_Bualt03G0206100 [Buddleja alternifolia]|uniref:Protein SIEVE ELEMENT OCCLUSION B-like n=1 Tax=Buddleja alternifolia TaxID=168488 RepID=A0AAV6XVD9_9LAMI|nr:hypothetical protein BUALT_Bualt03G0206100 [Buddleja alternifolia]
MAAPQDNAVIKQIEATHGPDDSQFSIKSLLSVIQDIIILSKPDNKRDDIQDISNKGIGSFDDKLVLKINNISWEILGNCSGGEQTNKTIFDVFNALSSFFWSGKAVLALAAFAVNYGEFWLLEQLRTTDPVAQSLALLEQLPSETVTFRNMADKLITNILDLLKYISSYEDLRSNNYVEPNTLKDMTIQIHTYNYWIIRSIVACQSQLTSLKTYGYTSSSTESSDITDLVEKLYQFGLSMRNQLDSCREQADEKRIEAVKQNLKKLFDISGKDNVTILKALISDKEDKPLYDGTSGERVKIDTLKRKTVLLYLSELKHSTLELSVLIDMYQQSGPKPEDYEIVWLPMVERSSLLKPEKKKTFTDIKNSMPWLTFHDVSLLDTAVVKYIKSEWQFSRRSMIKVVDGQGRLLVDHDAMHMILIWGNLAKPFSGKAEQTLWEKENWRVELLLNKIVPSAIQWAGKGKLICLYGGEDLEWIQKFKTTILAISRVANLPLMTLFMGASNMSNEIVNKYNAVISANEVNCTIVSYTEMMQFWARIESIWHSRVQSGMLPESDEIIREVFKMRSFDCSRRGWAIISDGSEEMAKGMGDAMLKCLSEYSMWMGNIEKKGFVAAIKDYISSFGTSDLRNTFSVTTTKLGELPHKMVCFECRREMKMSIRFTCCGD